MKSNYYDRSGYDSNGLLFASQWDIEECRVTKEEFLDDVHCGYVSPYDGHGYWGYWDRFDEKADAFFTSNSKIKKNQYTHVFWFNK